MRNAIKGATVLGLVVLGLNLSACSNGAANAKAEESPDPAEAAAAAMDAEAAKAAPAPEQPPAK